MMRCQPCAGGASPVPSVVPATSDLTLTSTKYVGGGTHSEAAAQLPPALIAPRAAHAAAAGMAQPSSAGQPAHPMITNGQVAPASSPTPSEGATAVVLGLSNG